MPFAAWVLLAYFVLDIISVFGLTVNQVEFRFTPSLLCMVLVTHSIAIWCVVSLAAAAR